MQINTLGQSAPKSCMFLRGTRQEKIIHVDDQEQLCFRKPEAAWMVRDRVATEIDNNLRKMLFPVTTGFGMTIQSTNEAAACALKTTTMPLSRSVLLR